MHKKQKRKILEDLLIEFNNLTPDLQKFNGDPASALAERLIKIINSLTPHANLFPDSFKIEIKKYILAYEDTRKNPLKPTSLPKLIKPTSELIKKTLENEVIKLS